MLHLHSGVSDNHVMVGVVLTTEFESAAKSVEVPKSVDVVERVTVESIDEGDPKDDDGSDSDDPKSDSAAESVSYTHLTLPTKSIV